MVLYLAVVGCLPAHAFCTCIFFIHTKHGNKSSIRAMCACSDIIVDNLEFVRTSDSEVTNNYTLLISMVLLNEYFHLV